MTRPDPAAYGPLLIAFDGRGPQVDPAAFVAPTATLIGDVTVGPQASIWFGCVVRADNDAIRIGARTNIQDLSMLHADPGKPLLIDEEVTVGHRVILHACRVGRGALIGMGAVVLTGAVIGEAALIAAGAVVAEGQEIPPRTLAAGVPARLLGPLRPEQLARLARNAQGYVAMLRRYHQAPPGRVDRPSRRE